MFADCVARSFTQIVVEFVGARETKSYSYLLNIFYICETRFNCANKFKA